VLFKNKVLELAVFRLFFPSTCFPLFIVEFGLLIVTLHITTTRRMPKDFSINKGGSQ